VELAIPKLRTGSYFPDWLLHYRRLDCSALETSHRPRLIPTLKAKAEAGVTIEILLGDPTPTQKVGRFRSRARRHPSASPLPA
jgi:hypothetical protein